MLHSLRDYQAKCRHAIHAAFETHNRVLVALPTGTGKTEIFVAVAQDWTTGRVLFVAPLIQLVGQAAKKIRQRTGAMPAIEQAENYSNESAWARSRFIVGSKQTLCGKRMRYQRFTNVGLVVIDEGHLSSGVFEEMVRWFVDQGAKVLVVTATPKLVAGLPVSPLADVCAFEYGIHAAINDGWLVAPRARCCQLESLDLSEVGKKSNGDFKDGELAAAMENDKVVFEIAEITAAESVGPAGRPLKTVVYCACVAEARKVAHRLVDTYGLKADWVCGDQRQCDDRRRQHVISSFTEDPDGLQIVCNVGVLTLGWDFPGLEHIVMARPTRSLALFTQILGRGTRPLEGIVDFDGSTRETRLQAIEASFKPTFKVTDLRDNSLAHKLVTTADVLAGKATSDKVITRAKKAIEKSKVATDVLAAIAQAERECEKLERARMQRISAKAKYDGRDVDLFDKGQKAHPTKTHRVARMPFGKHKGQPLSELTEGFLHWVIGKESMPAWLKKSCRTELYFRSRGIRRGDDSTKTDVDLANDLFAEVEHEPRRNGAAVNGHAAPLTSRQLQEHLVALEGF